MLTVLARQFVNILFFDYHFSDVDHWNRLDDNVNEEVLWLEIPVPPVLSSNNNNNNINITTNDTNTTTEYMKIGLVQLELMFWLKSFIFLSLQSFVNAFVAVIIYKWIVLPNKDKEKVKQTKKKEMKEDCDDYNPSSIYYSQQQLLFVYGIICPLLFFGPLYILSNIFDFYNIALMLCCSGAFPILFFRIIETMDGQLPNFAIESTTNFVLYYGATLCIQFDPITSKPITLTSQIFLSKIQSFISKFIQTSVLYSILLPYNYKIAPEKPIESICDLYYWGNIINAYMMASLTSLVLDAGASGLGLLQSIGSGYVMDSFHDSPLTKSTSPSDFWANRWDRPVQSSLRNGVYKPLVHHLSSSSSSPMSNTIIKNNGSKKEGGLTLIQKYSRHIAAFGTFIVSGILHEYVLYFMSFRRSSDSSSYDKYQPPYGHHMLFFLWNGIVLLLERMVVTSMKKKKQQQQTKSGNDGGTIINIIQNTVYWMKYNLPQPIQTMFVLLLVLPISHLFTDEYIKSSFYDDAAFAFPLFVIRR